MLGATLAVSGCSTITGSSGYGTRTSYAIDQDTQIARTLWDSIRADDSLDDTHINVDAYNGFVLLTGQVGSEAQKAQTGELATRIQGVRHLRNELGVGPNSSTQQRLQDTWITSRVKARLATSNRIDSDRVRILTENGTVYLMGMVRSREADYLVQLASQTSGVERIVKAFEYLDV
ncbi:BON domain-containing protein [Kushneria indalinina]|uniref:BON domain-containing protein n=1 Tax=Kushneria indalinina TaxID=184067 RepID=UPI001472E3B5|nr:BON domain-containing protein [Kushneria indalinina]